jgi:hypothetical protein
MDPVPALQPHIHARRAVIKATAPCSDQPCCEGADLPLILETDNGPFEPPALVQPDGVRPIDEDVRDGRIPCQLLKRPQAVQFRVN